MNIYLTPRENGLEISYSDDGLYTSDIISWVELAKHLAPHLPLPPAPTTGDDQ